MEIKKVIIQDGNYICDIDISTDKWKEILQDKTFMTKNYKTVLLNFYNEPNYKSTCKALGEKYNVSPQSLNASIMNFGKAVQKRLNSFDVIGADDKPTYWIIPMAGKSVGEHFEWTLRSELAKAIEEANMNDGLLQEIYDNAIKSKHWVFFDWFPYYEQYVKEYKEQAISNRWVDNIFQRLVKDTTENGISDLQQGNFSWEEYESIKSNWSAIQAIIKDIAEKNSITVEEYNDLFSFFGRQTKVNRPAAINRVIAAFLPNVVTTAVTQKYFMFVLKKMKRLLPDYPNITGDWLKDNFIFINYCNSKISFKHPWHSSLFAWYLKEYFETMNNKMQKRIEMINTYTNLLESNRNIILTGAPGTGKTYLAKQIAQQMIGVQTNEELEKSGQFAFVQFHPSYDYTDFVEGLRPTSPDENGNISFERKDGSFKDFCKKAQKATVLNEVDNFDEAWNNLITLIKNNLAEGKLTKIGSWDYGLSKNNTLKYSSENTPSQYIFTMTKQNIYDAYQEKKARPSGAFQKDMGDIVRFMKEHVKLRDYQHGTISNRTDNLKYIFIIDEINRGEISKIFGELFFSIDPGYRGDKGKVLTQYANLIDDNDVFKDGFYVPENVYIIGTMNDIDRSVENMDFAMRRRFAWKEIKAIDRISMWDGNIDEWKEEAKERMLSLNKAIENINGLSSAYHIGPAYFLKLKNYNGDFEKLWENHLSGVLSEYLRGFPNIEDELSKLKSAYNLL